MIVTPFQTEKLTKPFKLNQFVDSFVGEKIQNGDVLVIASKVVSIAEGQVIDLKNQIVTEEAWALSAEFKMDEKFCQAVLAEADEILGGVPGVISTMKNGIVTPYAGVDRSNVPKNHVVLWPKNPTNTAQRIRDYFKQKRNVSIGIIISDSQVVPLRVGSYGVAIAIAGFEGIISKIGEKDLFGKKMLVTRLNLADNLASAANLVMGETTERCPIALISGVKLKLSETNAFLLSRKLLMSPAECLIFGSLPSWGPENDASNLPQFS
ncbi:MAG: coenzyme F420-0:L-glutamate ligase [Caldisericia bacterium]|nr:coenzyme F420-0:L-glutamate ligase [Caldisericia bacterium]